MLGGTVCRMHGGAARQVAAKAAARRQQETIQSLLANLGTPTPVDPGQALLELIAAKNGEVHWLRAVVQSIEQDSLVWGRADYENGIGPQGPIDKYTDKASVNIWWEMLRKAEDQLASYSSAALKAGIEERRVRLAERTGNQVAAAMRRILDRLNLNPMQLDLVGTVVPEELRRMAEVEP
ncbi:hypothetical protein ACX8Z7_12355 [Glutamicibacter endophyticus]